MSSIYKSYCPTLQISLTTCCSFPAVNKTYTEREREREREICLKTRRVTTTHMPAPQSTTLTPPRAARCCWFYRCPADAAGCQRGPLLGCLKHTHTHSISQHNTSTHTNISTHTSTSTHSQHLNNAGYLPPSPKHTHHFYELFGVVTEKTLCIAGVNMPKNKTFDWKDAVYCCSQHAIEQNVWLKRWCVLLVSKCQWTKCATEKMLCITGVKMPMNKMCDWKRHCVLLVCKCQWTKCVTENTLCTIGVKMPMNKMSDWKKHCTAADNVSVNTYDRKGDTQCWSQYLQRPAEALGFWQPLCHPESASPAWPRPGGTVRTGLCYCNQWDSHHLFHAIITSGTVTTYFMLS